MNQLKKPKEKIKFSKLRLRSSTSKSNPLNSSRPNEKISTYFSSVLNETVSNSQLQNDSPKPENQKSNYLLSATPDDEDDFKETKIKKSASMLEMKNINIVNHIKKSRRNRKAVPTFGKNIIMEASCDTNQEHLQLAIAMSKSLGEIENPNSNSIEINHIYPSTQEKVTKIKLTLDQFGFRSNKSVTDLPTKPTRGQRKKFKHITPTLYLRTDEDRTKIIENKVSEIIENITIYYENRRENCPEVSSEVDNTCNKPNSFVLRDYYNEDAVSFRKNQLSISEMSQKVFYNSTVAPTNTKVGVLLKDWSSIPGREKSPPLLVEKEKMNSKISEKGILSPGQSSEILLSTNTDINDSSRRQTQPLKSNNIYVNSQSSRSNLSGKIFPENSNILTNMEISPKTSNLLNGTLITSEDSQKYVTSRNSTSELNDKSVLNNIRHLHVPTFINRSISPDLFSDNESDAEVLFNKNNMSPQFNKENNSQDISQNICSYTIDSSCDTILLSPKKIDKTNSSPEFAKNNNLFSPLRETSIDETFSNETKILSPSKNNKTTFENIFSNKLSNFNCKTEVINMNISSHVSSYQEISSGESSRDTVLWNGNKNVSPILQNDSNASSNFSTDTKLLSDHSEPSSVSLVEITPPKNKHKTYKGTQSESVSLLNISPYKNNANKSVKSFSAARKKILSEIKIIKSINVDENDACSGSSKTSKLCKKSPILNKLNINISGENNIHHFESFYDDSNDCFDLTQLSDDNEDVNLNNSIPTESKILDILKNKSTPSKNYLICHPNDDDGDFATTTQLTNSSENENDTVNLTMSRKNSMKMKNEIKTEKLTEESHLQIHKKSNVVDNQNECLDEQICNNIDKALILSSDTDDETDSSKINSEEIGSNEKEFIGSPASPSEFCYNKLYDEDINMVSFLGHINRKEIPTHALHEYKISGPDKISKEKYITNNESLNSPISSKNNNLVLDQTINVQKTKTKTLRRFFSEDMNCGREFGIAQKSFLSQSSQNKNIFNKSVNNGDKNEFSWRKIEAGKAADLNESIEDIEISDEEINYFCDKSRFGNVKMLSKSHLSPLEGENLSQSEENIETSDEKLNYSSITSVLLNNSSGKQKGGNRDDVDDVEFLSQYSINEPENSKYLAVSPIKEKADDVQFLNVSSINAYADINTEELNYSNNISHKRKKKKKLVDDTLEKNMHEVVNEIETNLIDFNDLPCNTYQYSESLVGECSKELNSTPKSTKKIPSRSDTRYSQTLKHPRVTDLCSPISNTVQKSILHLNDSVDNDLRDFGIVDNVEDINEIVEVKTPENVKHGDRQIITPNSEIIVKTNNVTPMPNYNDLNTPQRNKELEKFGLKPMKRAKGVKILQYIYDATHPVAGKDTEKIRKSSSDDEKECIIKRRKINSMEGNNIAGSSNNNKRIKKKSTNNRKVNATNITENIEIVGNKIAESESLEHMIFERIFSTRIASCRLPLHIAWHNFVSSQPHLHEKILLYEPLDIKDIYQNFKSFGFKFHIQDLIAFLNRKCITIRNVQVIRRKKICKLRKAK